MNRRIDIGVRKGGFTLIELLVVISIVGLLSSVVLAAVNTARARGNIAAGQRFDGHTYSAFYDNAVVLLDFDETLPAGSCASPCSIMDKSGNANQLSYVSPAGSNSAINPFRGGLSFFTLPGTVTVTTASEVKGHLPGSYSISFWVYPTGSSPINFLANRPAGGIPPSNTWAVGDTGSNLSFSAKSTSASLTVSASPLENNRWHHILASCSNSRLNLYVNGKNVATSGTFSGGETCSSVASGQLLRIGVVTSLGAAMPFYIDNVRIYNNAF